MEAWQKLRLDRAKEQNPRVGAMAEQRGPASVEDVKRLGDRLKYALIGIRLIGTKTTRGKEFLSECLSTAGLDFTTPDDLLRDMVVTAALEAVHEIDALITSTPGAFLGGDKPDIADVFLAPMLLYTHNLLESGIAALPQQPPWATQRRATEAGVRLHRARPLPRPPRHRLRGARDAGLLPRLCRRGCCAADAAAIYHARLKQGPLAGPGG